MSWTAGIQPRLQAPKRGSALEDFLAREAVGSPYEAAQLGGPVNGLEPAASGAAAYPRDLDAAHGRLLRYFEEAERSGAEARALAERDIDYYHGEQWTAAEQAILRARKQPELTINYVRRKIDLLSGLERKSRTDPKAWPRTPQEEPRAEAATQALRFFADDTNLPDKRSAVYHDMLTAGYGGAEMGLEDDGKGGLSITLTAVDWDRLFHDPHSRARDFSDARYVGIVVWQDRDTLEEMYPDAADIIGEAFDGEHGGGGFQDRPGTVAWSDNQRERVRVVQIYWLERGEWWGATISRAGFLLPPEASRFLDAKGRSACPLVLQSAYVDRENNRYGAARDLISLQDEINKRRSKALHLLSVNRVVAERGAVQDVERARREVARPDGYIEIMPGMKFDVASGADLATGQFQLLQHATGEMQASGPNASMSGSDPRELSGRAILAQQAGGAAANEPLADELRQWTKRLCEMAWMAARQHWREERWLRISDDVGTTQWVGLNRKVTLAAELQAMEEYQRAATMQQLQLVPNDPRLGQVVRVENEIHDLEVDIQIEEGPDVPAQQAEDFALLMQLAGSQPGIIPPDVLIAASSLRNKGDLLKRMKEAQEAAAQAQQAQMPMMQANAQAEIRGKAAKASADEALAVQRIAQIEQSATEAPYVPVGPTALPPQALGFPADNAAQIP